MSQKIHSVNPFDSNGILNYYSLVCITIRGGGEVDLHDQLELSLVAAVLEGGVVVVAAEHIGLVV